MNKQPILETKRLKLRPFALSDAKDVQSMAGDYRVAEMTENIPHPYTDGMAEQWISKHQKNWITQERVTWAVCSKSNAELIGCIGLVINAKHRRASLGYWVGHVNWSKGFCSEAAIAVIKYGFEDLKLQRVEALHLTKNPASGAVMRKIGMNHEGTMLNYVLKEDVFEDMERYAILAD